MRKKLINNAFYSNEEQFKECFSVFPDSKKAYDFFTDGMRHFYHNNMSSSTHYYSKGKSIMDNFFNEIFELSSPIKSLSKGLKPLGGGFQSLNNEDIHLS